MNKMSLPMAYAMKKRAKKMADGGMLTDDGYQSHDKPEVDGGLMPKAHLALELEEEMKPDHDDHMKSGIEHDVENQLGDEDEGAGGGDPIHPMVKRIVMGLMKGYSEGGMVANEDKRITGSMPDEFDDLALRDDLEFSDTGANSGDELGDAQEDEDRHDMVSRIIRSRSKKDRMPRPA